MTRHILLRPLLRPPDRAGSRWCSRRCSWSSRSWSSAGSTGGGCRASNRWCAGSAT